MTYVKQVIFQFSLDIKKLMQGACKENVQVLYYMLGVVERKSYINGYNLHFN